MTPAEYMQQLHLKLVAAARKRHAAGAESFPAEDFEKFMSGVETIGKAVQDMTTAGLSVAHIGMAVDFYKRTMDLVLAELTLKQNPKQSEAHDGSTEEDHAGQPDRPAAQEEPRDQKRERSGEGPGGRGEQD